MQIKILMLALAAVVAAPGVSAKDANTGSATAQAEKSSIESYIIRFADAGALYYDGSIAGLEGTALSQTGQRKLDVNTAPVKNYRNELQRRQLSALNTIRSKIARGVSPSHTYDITFSGMALDLSADEAAQLRQIPGISSVTLAGTYTLDTDAGPAFIGAPGIWNGSNVPSGTPSRGEGVVVGVIDSGANSDHPSFANDAACGFSPANPKLLSAKDCNQASCIGGDPEDTSTTSSGHGVHTSSTAAGNALTVPLVVGGVALRFNISGVAPCAKVRTYKACTDTCPGAALLAAMQETITDQVDVVNYSISGGTSPWNDFDRNFLDMVNADIYVAASAGNTRAATPDPVGAVNHLGPWVMTVANSTHDRVIRGTISVAGSLQNVQGQAGGGPDLAQTTAQVAPASVAGNETGCTGTGGLAPGSMTGRIALIARGGCTFVEKVNNASGAGAIAAVLYMADATPPITPGGLEATTIGAFMISQADGIAIRDFITANPSALATVQAGRVIDPSVADVLNASSLRGPNTTFDVTKPDITGPGTNIYAAVSDVAGQFGFLTGTSMSSPHLAGAGALIRAVHPTWTPQEVKSAIQLTAVVAGRKDNAVTPWDADDVGNGRVDLTTAARTGIVMNETFANFLAANPQTAGPAAVRALNLPSYRNISCNGTCTFTRTFRNTRTTPTSWTVLTNGAPANTVVTASPSSFAFTGQLNEVQTVTFTVGITSVGANGQGTPITANAFGGVTLRANDAQVPDARLTITVRGNSDVLLRNGFE